MPQLLLVPLGELVVVLLFDGELFNVVLQAPFEPGLVTRYVQQGELDGVPLLCVDLLQVPLPKRIRVVMHCGARLAQEDPVSQLEVARLVAQAIYAVCIVGVLRDHDFEQVSDFFSAVLSGVLWQAWRFGGFALG